MEKVYVLSGLDCPNCAAKIEAEVGALSGVSRSSVNLLKQTLTVSVEEACAGDTEQKIKDIVHSHEPEVEVSERAEPKEEKRRDFTLPRLALGAAVFAAGLILSTFAAKAVWLCVLIAAYIILGGDVVARALRNIVRGRVFDENFLMSLSTVGAFFIGEYPEAVAVMLFYQIGEYFQERAVHRSRKSISDLMNIRPDSANVLRDGEYVTLSPDDVAVGERIMIKAGERVPLDGVIISGEGTIDTAALTGESLPREVRVGDTVLCGFVNLSGVLTVEVTRLAGESTAAKIIDLVENAAEKKAPTENFITKFACVYTPAVVIIALLLGVVPPLLFGGWADWLHRAFVFLVISCPCALVISVPLAFFGGIGAASRHGVLIKGGNFLEALCSADTAVFDKTGTLTKGVFNVTEIIPAEGFTANEVLSLAARAESLSTHPIAKSICDFYGKEMSKSEITDYKELSGHGVSATVDGKKTLLGNQKLMREQNIVVPTIDAVGTRVYVAAAGKYMGCLLIADEIKKDSRTAIEGLRKMGIKKTVMLTGDEEKIARAVANKLGIDEYHASLLPDGKVFALERIASEKSGKVIFVGDGINDAPVLARADIGIAMGGLGSDAAIEAADIVLMTDEPTALYDALRIAKDTRRIVMQNIVFSLAVKGLFLLLGALGIAGMWEAVFGDVGVALIAVLNSVRILKK